MITLASSLGLAVHQSLEIPPPLLPHAPSSPLSTSVDIDITHLMKCPRHSPLLHSASDKFCVVGRPGNEAPVCDHYNHLHCVPRSVPLPPGRPKPSAKRKAVLEQKEEVSAATVTLTCKLSNIHCAQRTLTVGSVTIAACYTLGNTAVRQLC